MARSDGKRPDGLTLVPWSQGKPLTWDVTVICSSADSYIGASERNAGAAAELAAARKNDKYSGLTTSHIVEPIAIETLGPFNSSALVLLGELGHRISANSNDLRESSYLFQRLSLNIQRFNVILIHETFVSTDYQEQ